MHKAYVPKVDGMSERIAKDRDIELENIIGNLMIAEYQVDKLQSRLSEGVWVQGVTGNPLHLCLRKMINGIELCYQLRR